MYSGVLVPQPGIRNHLLQRKAFLMLTGVLLNYALYIHCLIKQTPYQWPLWNMYNFLTQNSSTAYNFIPIECAPPNYHGQPPYSPNCMGLEPVGKISEILHLYPSTNDQDEMWTSCKFIAFNEWNMHLILNMHFILNMYLILNMHLPFTMNNLPIPHIPRAPGFSAWSVWLEF